MALTFLISVNCQFTVHGGQNTKQFRDMKNKLKFCSAFKYDLDYSESFPAKKSIFLVWSDYVCQTLGRQMAPAAGEQDFALLQPY